MSLTYAEAGVDIENSDSLTTEIKKRASKGPSGWELPAAGGFAAALQLPPEVVDPVILAATDGVGTKVHLAAEMGRLNTIGVDLVAMCVNDIMCHGGRPTAFLDYYASNTLDSRVLEVVEGIVWGCDLARVPLVGGETAEMPGTYRKDALDLAGFALGVVERSKMLPRGDIQAGDSIIGVPSSGLHSNGYSLVRKVLENPQAREDLEMWAEEADIDVLQPTTIYTRLVDDLLGKVGAIAHITGGGLVANTERVIPGFKADIDWRAWVKPTIYHWLSTYVKEAEMRITFNCGIGLAIVTKHPDEVLAVLRNHGYNKSTLIGVVV